MQAAEPAFRIVGRDELIRLTSDVAQGADGAPAALVLVGEAGIGKSTLLRRAVASAARFETRTLFTAGGEPGLLQAYSSIAELIWPLLEFVDALPAVLSATLSEVLGTTPAAVTSRGPMQLRQAFLALLQLGSAATPLLLAIDDFDRIDRDSRDVLEFVICRLVGMQVRALLTVRRADSIHGIDRVIPTLEVPPLSDGHAAELVSAQARKPDPSVRGEIIRWSSGNPLALIEAARAYGRSGAKTFRGQSVVGAGGAYRLFAHQLADLPADSRKLVLYAAAGAGYETLGAVTEAAGYGHDFSRWEPATSAGLLDVTADRHIQFRHPLIRAAVYGESTSEERHAAHLGLARSPHVSPPCRAWHLASATTSPDESIAAALETSSILSQSRGGYLEVARTLQRAAELSPVRDDAGRRYGLAAAAANFGGDAAWALALTDNAYLATDDTDLRGYAALTRASILMQSAQPLEAFYLIQGVLNGPSPPQGKLALDLVYLAASASYYSGETRHRRPLHGWLEQVANSQGTDRRLPAPFPAESAELQRAYIRMYADTPDSPHGRPGTLDQRCLQTGAASVEPYRRLVAGIAGYVIEDSVLAARDLTKAVERLKASGGLRGFTYAIAPLLWALLDTGRWNALSELLDETANLCAIQDFGLLDLETGACRAQLLAYRGDYDGATKALSRARREAPPAGASSATEVALSRAAGWQAATTGDFDDAYRLFRQMFHPDGEPVHFVVSHRGIADLAWAAARSGRRAEVQPLIASIGAQLGSDPPVRLRLLRHHALALVETAAHLTEPHYRLAVFDPAGEDWPLDRARARLHYGEWLRRARRPAEARPLLTAALEVFHRLGAQPLAEIASAELRAAGITPTTAPPADAFESLTAQEQQIVVMAASGLTNREIADRLNLSPRTIGSHLYHVYPKLGVSRRHELREFAP